MIRRLSLGAALVALSLAAAPGLAAAAANHPFLGAIAKSPGGREFEDACGLALGGAGLYVSDYYHDAIELPGGGQISPEDPGDGPCKLALDGEGNLYVNNWHRDVLRYPAAELRAGAGAVIDPVPPGPEGATGLALDPATGDLYVAHRTYVAKYEAPVQPGEAPRKIIGEGSLGEAYGLAVSRFPATAGEIYVPDAKDRTVKVFDSTGSLVETISGEGTPQGGFAYLVDAEVALDNNPTSPSYGHLFVLDAIEHGRKEQPAAVLDEFNAAGAYRGQIAGFTDAEPSGIAIEGSSGDVYLTSGNSEGSAVFHYGPTAPAHTLRVLKSGAGAGTLTSQPAGIACGGACAAEYDAGEKVTLLAAPEAGSAFAGWSVSGAEPCPGTGTCTVSMSKDVEVTASFKEAAQPLSASRAGGGGGALTGEPAGTFCPPICSGAPATLAQAQITQKGNLRVAASGKLSPIALPRHGAAPVAVSVTGKISTTDESPPPQLQSLQIEINRHGRIESVGLPTCRVAQIQPASNGRALAACGGALVGQGRFAGTLTLPGAPPYPISGRMLLFNGPGHTLIGHIYTPHPFATSFVIVFKVSNRPHGKFATTLSANLAKALGKKRSLTSLEMTLKRTYPYKGHKRSFVSAGCPAPDGFPGALFTLARTSFSFAGGTKLSSTLTGQCRVRR